MTEPQQKGFEGSYLGDNSQLADNAVLECKICWYQYQPEEGDEVWQIAPGTPFSQLPDHWCCPQCDGDKDQFMIVD
ncbi:rubredoxin [Oceanobacter mangrovi]|uniref:rubredoxin n=1 Tax=Oceanobacter mangrovi TaxID=2862510 RepID=UPI001FE53D05|nr:rubredoxin [Oceanobacter mangrovi]